VSPLPGSAPLVTETLGPVLTGELETPQNAGRLIDVYANTFIPYRGVRGVRNFQGGNPICYNARHIPESDARAC